MNDATREAGGALGVAVIGSVFSSVYVNHLSASPLHALPAAAFSAARSSVGAAQAVVAHVPYGRPLLTQAVTTSFMSGLHVACAVAAAVCWAGAVAALRLPGRTTAVTFENTRVTRFAPCELAAGD